MTKATIAEEDAAKRIINKMATTANSSLFGVEYVPSAITHPELSHPDTVVDHVFSYEELSLLSDLLILDENAASNMLGLTILHGRSIPEVTLHQLLAESIPYGLGQLIENPVAFFKDIGEIVLAQQTAKFSARCEGNPEPDFADPAEIAFTRHTNFNADQATGVFSGTFFHGGTAKTAEPVPAPEALDSRVQSVVDLLTIAGNNFVGEGNFDIQVVDNDIDVFIDVDVVSPDAAAIFYETIATILAGSDEVTVSPGARHVAGSGGGVGSLAGTTYVAGSGGAGSPAGAAFGDDGLLPHQQEAVNSLLEEIFGAGNFKVISEDEFTDVIKSGSGGGVTRDFLFPGSPSFGVGKTAQIDDAGVNLGDILQEIRNDVQGFPHETLDETFESFLDLSKAGTNDANILAKQIAHGVAAQSQIIEMLEQDADNLIKAANGIKAGLSLLVATGADLDRLKGNAKMISDAFDALTSDVSTLQRIRSA